MSRMTLTRLPRAINERHGAEPELAGRFAGGEQGPYWVIDRAGTELALKVRRGAAHFERLRAATATTARLRVGYPAPEYH